VAPTNGQISVQAFHADGAPAVRIPLAQFGIENFYLTLLFRVGAAGE